MPSGRPRCTVHPHTPENTIIRPEGWKECRACKRLRDQARPRKARKEARRFRNVAIVDLYLSGESAEAIGRVFGISDTAVRGLLRRRGVKTRPRCYWRKAS